jgi:hypothetical protein
LVGKPQRKKPHGRPRLRWIISKTISEKYGMNCTELVHDKVIWQILMVLNLHVP